MRNGQRNRLLTILVMVGVFILIMTGCRCNGCGSTTPPDPSGELPDAGAEAGDYYYDAGTDGEYTLTLGGKSVYTLTVKGVTETGTYTLDGSAMTLKKDDTVRTATLGTNELTLMYEGAQLRFLRKIEFTVSFDSAGGSAVESLKTINGKSVAAPADPTRDGYVFLGWYSNADYKQPFVFDATPVTENLTLVARWAEKPAGTQESRISYDLGYEGETIPDAETIGGRLYNAAVPAAREGYRFVGWWISDTNRGDQLTYRFVEAGAVGETVFRMDTTLFAVWQSTSAACDTPAVSVSATAVTWDAVNATAYLVKITAPDGSVMVDNQRSTSTTFPVTFSMAGAYTVEVTAVDAGGKAVSDTSVRVFTNRGLDRVTGFTVIDPSVLTFRGVEHAEKYLITVSCGNEQHNHVAFDNGLALYFNFANCDMKQGGIVFTVRAIADGYAASTATFVYERNLERVTGLTVKDDVVTWNAVTGAAVYRLTVNGETYVTLGTNFSLSGFDDGAYSIEVTPVAHGYNSPETASLSYDKKTPAMPENLRLTGTVLSWDAVKGAAAYAVKVGDKTLDVAKGETKVDLAGSVSFTDGADYEVTFSVTGQNGTVTKQFTVRYNAMNPQLTYGQSILRWTSVVGAQYYEVQINDTPAVRVEDGTCSYFVESFTRIGENTLRVRFFNGTYYSEWAELTVVAHKLTLDARGGSAVESVYKAVGDVVTLPTLTKNGYTFSAWYNLPNGAESNGRRYTDSYYVESGDAVLYAYYTPKAYTLHYDIGDDSDQTETVYYGKNYQLMVPTASSGTRVFGGWFSAPYGAGIAFTDAKGNSLSAWNFTDDDVTVYAFWVDSALRFEKIGNAYAVSKGARIDLVSSVTIPPEYMGLPVTEIVGGAFENCKTLTEIRLPDTLTRIATDSAFTGCDSLVSVEVYESGEVKYARYSSADGVLFDGGESGSAHAPRPVFMPMAKTGVYTVPAGVDVIPRSAFANSGLSKIILPVSVREIGTEAFANCESLTSVVFAEAGATNGVNGLTIGDRAFLNCTSLTVMTLPARLQSISLAGYVEQQGTMSFTDTPNAFEGCENLTDIVVAKGSNAVYTSEDGVLLTTNGTVLAYFPAAKQAEGYRIPAGVTRIGDGAFLAVSGLKGELTLPGRIISVGTAAFAKCHNLTKVTFEKAISDVTVGDYAFFGTGISEITFAEGSRVTSIGNAAFKKDDTYRDTDEDKKLVIPATVKQIGNEAFAGFGVLDVEILEGTAELTFGNNVFYDCEIGTLHIPKNVTALANFFTGMLVEEIDVAEGNKLFLSVDGVLYSKGADGKPETLLIYPSAKSDYEFEVPEGVTAIADGAFKGQTNIEEITLPASLTSVGKEAFSGCEYLETVTFLQTSGTLRIGEYAFYKTALEELALPEGVAITIDAYAFAETRDMDSLTLGGVVTIGDHAFEGAAYYGTLDVVFPASLESVGNYAFYNACLDTVEFEKNAKLSTIGAYAFAGASFSRFTVPASVKSIAAYAFASNSYLSDLSFEEGDTDLVIGVAYGGQCGNVVNGCSSLKELHFPARLTEIGKQSFANMYRLKTVTFGSESNPSRLVTIGEEAFYCSGLTAVTIPASVRNTDSAIAIGNNAFGLADLESLTFEMGGSAPLTLGEGAFYGIHVETVELPARLAFFDDGNGNIVAPLANGRGVFSSYVKAYNIVGDGKGAYASVDGLIYNADLTELIFCPAAKEGEVVIPKTVKKVAAYAFNNCKSLTGIRFEDGSVCEEIGEQAFSFCTQLGTVGLPDSVAEIGADAFMRCDELHTLTIPAALQVFDTSIVSACPKLQNLLVSDKNTLYRSVDGVLFSADGKTLVYYLPTRSAETYTVPNGTQKIAEGAFSGNTFLTEVTIPTSVALIDRNAFSGCKALKTVNFTAGGTAALVIGYNAFSNTGLTSVEIPARTESVNASAFYGSRQLASLTFAKGCRVKYIGDNAFSSTALRAAVLPQSLREMGDGVFAGCGSLEDVTLPEGLLTVGKELFYNCSSLMTVNLPSTLQSLGNYAFYGCESLKSVNFAKDSVISVLYVGTFYGCTALESIELPASLTEIPDKGTDVSNDDIRGLFNDCVSLKRVVFAEGSRCTKIGGYAFSGTALESITFPSSLATVGEYAFADTKLSTLTIPVTVTSLGEGAFQGCEDLVSVSLGSGVKVLPSGVFANCSSLTSFTIPASVISIDSGAFWSCDGIEKFVLDQASQSFREQDGVIYDMSWRIVLFPATKTSYTIPKGTTELPENFFEDFDIKELAVEEGNTAFVSIGGVVYDTAMTRIVFFSDEVTEFEIPATLPSSMTVEEFFELLIEKGLESVTISPENTLFKELFGAIYYVTEDGLQLVYVPLGLTEFVIPKDVTLLYDFTNGSFFYGGSLRTVTFEEGGTEDLIVYDGFFRYATQLETVTLPERTVRLGSSVFANCSSLRVVNLPSTLTSISNLRNMFSKANSLEQLNVAEGNEAYCSVDGVLYQLSGDGTLSLAWFPVAKTTFVIPANLSYLSSLSRAVNLVSVTVQKDADGNELVGVADSLSLSSDAFQNLTNLETIELPSRVSGLTKNMFKGCTALRSITFGEGAMYKSGEGCAVYEKDTSTELDAWKLLFFPDSARFDSFEIPADVSEIGYGVFEKTGVKTITAAARTNGLTLTLKGNSWGSGVFANCTELVSVELPDGVTAVADSTFYQCTSLEKVVLPAGVTYIGNMTFYGCSSLRELVLPAGLTTIGENAFEGCNALKSVVLSASVTKVGYSAFSGWTAEQTVYVAWTEDNLPSGYDSRWLGRNPAVKVVYGYAGN